VSFEAEILYARMEARSRGEKVPVILARHCNRGQVLLDRVSQSFNGGCASNSQILELVRVSPKKELLPIP